MTESLAKQIPPQRRMSRFVGGIGSFVKKSFYGRGISHSTLFGVASGVFLWCGLYAYRSVRLALFDCESVPLASRQRYEEKQMLYQQELSNEMASSIIASMVKEYNPIHLRLPFTDLSPQATEL